MLKSSNNASFYYWFNLICLCDSNKTVGSFAMTDLQSYKSSRCVFVQKLIKLCFWHVFILRKHPIPSFFLKDSKNGCNKNDDCENLLSVSFYIYQLSLFCPNLVSVKTAVVVINMGQKPNRVRTNYLFHVILFLNLN